MVQIFGASPRRILRRKETWSNWPNGAEESPKHVLNHAKSKKWHDFCFGSRSLGHRDPLKSFFTSWSCHSYCQVISKSGNLNLIYHWLPLVTIGYHWLSQSFGPDMTVAHQLSHGKLSVRVEAWSIVLPTRHWFDSQQTRGALQIETAMAIGIDYLDE